MIKRIFDLFFATIILLFLFPLFVIIGVCIKLDSKGPIFFRQTRVGLYTSNFKIYKFRSMYLHENKEINKNYEGTQYNDIRITKIGQFIRKYHIDELPQFINVLIGDMSTVGPRPDVPRQEIQYSIYQWKRRHDVRPGITGLAQIFKGNSRFDHHLRIALDLYYVRKISTCTDLFIMIKTLSHVLKGKSF